MQHPSIKLVLWMRKHPNYCFLILIGLILAGIEFHLFLWVAAIFVILWCVTNRMNHLGIIVRGTPVRTETLDDSIHIGAQLWTTPDNLLVTTRYPKPGVLIFRVENGPLQMFYPKGPVQIMFTSKGVNLVIDGKTEKVYTTALRNHLATPLSYGRPALPFV